MTQSIHSAKLRFVALAPIALLAALSACSSSSGGGGVPTAISEDETVPNDTPAAANALKVGTPILGSVAIAGDVDCFALPLAAGKIVKFELFGTRNDQADWDTNGNIPRLTILDTDTNANAKLLEQDFSGNFSDGWSWGYHDLDIPLFKVPATGTYYACVTQDDDTLDGGAYILRASYVSLPGMQEEAEARGVSGENDDFSTAQAIHTGTIHGYHVADELDYYSFTISSPTVVRFQLTAYQNGVHDDTAIYYDTIASLYDTDGTTQLFSNDDAVFYDSGIQYEIDTPGTYFFAVDQYDLGMSGEYFLSFTTSAANGSTEVEPNDDAATANSIAYGGRAKGTLDVGETDFYKFSGKAGDMVRLQRFDSSIKQDATATVSVTLVGTDGTTDLTSGGDDDFQVMTAILQETGTFYIRVAGAASLTDYRLELTRFQSSTYEVEPNDLDADAAPLVERVSGAIDPNGDVDTYKVALTKDKLVRFSCYASDSATDSNGSFNFSGHGSDLAPLIEILDETDTLVASSTSVPVTSGVFTESVTDSLPTNSLVWTAPASGNYFVRISDANAGNGATYYYVLEYENR
ncbi:MAG: hypothetical protein IPJ19_15425 [Planctomycetes bacterium]|nr:hypothetical protein [Planctomycetota bacterium]